MIVHKNWVINSALSSVIVVACVVGDKKVQSMSEPLTKALIDNSTHAIIGLLSAIIVLIDHWDSIYLAVVCMTVSSFIDLDHFLTAKSFKLSVKKTFFLLCFNLIMFFRMRQTYNLDHFSTTAQFQLC